MVEELGPFESHLTYRRRSHRVRLQVQVYISFDTNHPSSRTAQAFTSSVSAHGGLIEVSVRVESRERISLINPTTNAAVICRVVDAKVVHAELTLIAFEFELPNANFWPITFPPEELDHR